MPGKQGQTDDGSEECHGESVHQEGEDGQGLGRGQQVLPGPQGLAG